MKIYKKLHQVQQSIDVTVANRSGQYGKYLDLAAVIETIRKPANDAGLVVLQEFKTFCDGQQRRMEVITEVRCIESDECISHTCDWDISSHTIHQVASARTYLCRYALTTLFLIPVAEDDNAKASMTAESSDKKDDKSDEWDQIANAFMSQVSNDAKSAFDKWQGFSRVEKGHIFERLPDDFRVYLMSDAWAALGGQNGPKD